MSLRYNFCLFTMQKFSSKFSKMTYEMKLYNIEIKTKNQDNLC